MQLIHLVPGGEQLVRQTRPHPILLLGPALWTLGLLGLAGGVLAAGHHLESLSEFSGWELSVAHLVGETGVHRFAWLALVLGLLGLLGGGLAGWGWAATHYGLSFPVDGTAGGHLLVLHGVIHQTARTIPLTAVNDLGVDLSLSGRLLGYGTLQVLTGNDQVDELPTLPAAAEWLRACQAR